MDVPKLKKPDIKLPEIRRHESDGGSWGWKGSLDPMFDKVRASTVERTHELSVVMKSVILIIVASLIMLLICVAIGEIWSFGDYMNNIFCNTIALLFIVICLDTIVSSNKAKRRRRDEVRKILRYDRVIQPDIDMYLVRKNMVITPNGKTMRKFQVDATFTVRDMRDMYTASELVADVGISKIKRYGHFQGVLRDDFQRLAENVDFAFFPEVAEAVMRYLNATSYGQAALDAVIGYEDSRAGTKSMRVMVAGMIKDEPEDGRFIDANPAMKNVYLVHQMINEQEHAVADYLRVVKVLREESPEYGRQASDYENE